MPDINQVAKAIDQHLLPGRLKFLTGKRKIDRVRVFALGVKPEYQHPGIRRASMSASSRLGRERNQPRGETGWILEVNEPMNRAMEGMGEDFVVKRYRLYERTL